MPRLAVILRKAMGGAYIVMDSKGLGQHAVPGLAGRPAGGDGRPGCGADPAPLGRATRSGAELEDAYGERFLAPWEAAERGFIDMVIDPADTRRELARALCQRGEPAGAPGRAQARRGADVTTVPLNRERPTQTALRTLEQGSDRPSPNRNGLVVDLSLPSGKIDVVEQTPDVPLVLESCHSTWLFDTTRMRFRRILKGLNLDARNASTAWRPYFGLELDPYSESFVVHARTPRGPGSCARGATSSTARSAAARSRPSSRSTSCAPPPSADRPRRRRPGRRPRGDTARVGASVPRSRGGSDLS